VCLGGVVRGLFLDENFYKFYYFLGAHYIIIKLLKLCAVLRWRAQNP